jgi:hypothetical protein
VDDALLQLARELESHRHAVNNMLTVIMVTADYTMTMAQTSEAERSTREPIGLTEGLAEIRQMARAIRDANNEAMSRAAFTLRR